MHDSLTSEVFDIVVVGAGVVGCAIARQFTLQGARVAVVEKASDILDGASKANSAILHTGFDAPQRSLELKCIRDGYQEYLKIRSDLGLPIEKVGAHVVAWDEDEVEKLVHILKQAHENGIANAELIDGEQLAKREPNLSNTGRAAISIPDESIIDPWSAPYAYLKHAICNGTQIYLSCEVTNGSFDGSEWLLQTSKGALRSRFVINCAGLYGDRLDQDLVGKSTFRILPRKGQFVVFDKAASKLINSIILPVPTKRTKGIVVCRTIFGNLLVGPTAEDQTSRTDSSTDQNMLEALIASGVEKIPALENMPITATYAGLRPATDDKEYQITTTPEQNWITVGGIRSTGLSGALGIAKHVFAKYSDLGFQHSTLANPNVPEKTTALSEYGARDWQQEAHGPIVCHCELVTEREILSALSGPLAAHSLAGLKRQTRATMGRCQGFYCSARLSEITNSYFEQPLTEAISHE